MNTPHIIQKVIDKSPELLYNNLSCYLFQRNRVFGLRFADIEQIGRVFAQLVLIHRKKLSFCPFTDLTKMNRKIRKATIPIIWLLIYVFTIPTQLSSYVLCIGVDGHIEFETAIDGRCTDTPATTWEQSTFGFTKAPSPEDHCGSCFDIVIFVSANWQQAIVPTQNVSPAYSVSIVAAIASLQTTTTTILPLNAFPNLPLRILPTLGSLRTVILLI